MRTVSRHLTLMIVSTALVLGCDQSPASRSDDPMKLQLNWKAEPQFGGFYAASISGALSRRGLNVEIVEGGVGTPTVQMVGAGTVAFGVVSADEVIIARSRGQDVVALMAVYQTCPQGLMTRASRGLTSISDIFSQPGTLAVQQGLPYADFLKNKYGFENLHVVPSPGGDISVFRSDENYTMQCFITSEPLAAKKVGVEPRTFLVADAGYNPYTTVLVTRGTFLRENHEQVKQIVAGFVEGWRAYLDDPSPANQVMQKLNPSMDAQTFIDSAIAQKPLIETPDTAGNGLGSMTLARWETLGKQLVDLKIIDQAPPAETCFEILVPTTRQSD